MKYEHPLRWWLCGCLLLATAGVQAKLDGRQLHTLSMNYQTPHLKWAEKTAPAPLRTLFIVPRKGGREVIELLQRVTMEYTEFLCYDHLSIAKNDMYDAPYEGTSMHEKQQELLQKLEKEYDLIVLGEVLFSALPDEAKYFILSRVEKGCGLLLVNQVNSRRLPYRKLYAEPLPEPDFFADFPIAVTQSPARKGKLFQASRLGRGKIVHVSYGNAPSYGLSLTPYIPYDRTWFARYENAMAWLGRVCLWTAGREPAASARLPELADTPRLPANAARQLTLLRQGGGQLTWRLRNAFNVIVATGAEPGDTLTLPPLPPGHYYCDLRLAENGADIAFGYQDFEVESPLGNIVVATPAALARPAAIQGSCTLEKGSTQPLQVTVALLDSPGYQVWHRQELALPAGQQSFSWQISDYDLPTIAGIVRLTFAAQDGTVVGSAESTLFFPDYRLDDYVQMSWNNLDESVAPFLAPILIDRLGWNLGLSHPSDGGDNARASALFNQRFVPYMVRICITRGSNGSSKQYRWFFLPKEEEAKVKDLQEDECFYRPEVQDLWAAGIAHRIRNLPRYSPVIYNLGDENSLDMEAGFGPSDLIYFRKFLQDKYGDLAALNREWQSAYGTFDEVPHLTLQASKEQGNFAAWFDHRQYMEKMYADIHHFLADEIKKHDPQARVGAEGSVPGELEQTIDKLEFWGPYSNLVHDEALRSFGGDRIRMLWWGGYPGSHGGRSRYPMPILGDILKGTINGNSWFTVRVGNHGLTNCDYEFAPYVKNYLPYLDDLRWGIAPLLINNPQIASGIGIFWSHASSAARMLDERCVNPADGIGTLIRTFYQCGLSFEFVSSRTLARLDSLRVLFLCGSSALSEAECAAIQAFAERGGTVVADMNPAILNGFLRPREANPLQELFGPLVFSQLQAPQLGTVEVSASLRNQPLSFKANKAFRPDGAASFVVRPLGQGQGVLLNFGLATAESTAAPETPFDGFIGQLLQAAGVTPPFPVSGQDKFALVRTRQGQGFQVIGFLLPEARVGSTLQLTLPAGSYVYECKQGLVGQSQGTLALPFADSPFRVLAVFPELQREPVLLPGRPQLPRGSRQTFDLSGLPAGRVYFLQLHSPDGHEQLTRNQVFDTAKAGPVLTLPFSFDDQPGTWTCTLQDVATGLTTRAAFELQ